MNPFRLCSVLVVLLFTIGLAGTQTPETHGGAMLDCSGLPCVEVTLSGGKHLRLLIDTGDADSVVDAAVAKEMDLSLADVKGLMESLPRASRALSSPA